MATYRQSTKEVLSLLEDLEKKLNKHKPLYPNEKDNYNLNNNHFISNPISINSNNYSEMGYQNNFDKITPSMEFNIRKLIKDEFSTLILPYQEEMHNSLNIMDTKVDKNSNEIKDLKLKNLNNLNNLISNDNLGFGFNQPNHFDNNQYVLRVEYENKINELEIQLSTLNTYSKTLKEAFDNKVMGSDNYLGKDEFGLKINDIQNQFDSVISEIKQIEKNISNFNQSLSEIKINNNKDKNELLIEIQNIKNDFSDKVKMMNNNFNSIDGKIQNQANNNNLNGQILNLSSNLDNLKNQFNVLNNQLDLNFINSLKTIVNQHVTVAELNLVKNAISGCENNINQIINKNYDMNISNIQNKITSLENKMNTINLKNKNNSEIGEISEDNNKINTNLNENQLNILNELQKIDLNKFQKFDFNSFNEIKNEIKDNNENYALMKTKLNELDTEINKLKQKIDWDNSVKDLKNSITNINERITRLEGNYLKRSKLEVEPINSGDEENNENNRDNDIDNDNINRNNVNLNDNNQNMNKDSTNENVIQKNPFNSLNRENNLEKVKNSSNKEIERDEESNPRQSLQRSGIYNNNDEEEEKKQDDENQNNNKEKNSNNIKKSRNGNTDDDNFDIGDMNDLLIDDNL